MERRWRFYSKRILTRLGVDHFQLSTLSKLRTCQQSTSKPHLDKTNPKFMDDSLIIITSNLFLLSSIGVAKREGQGSRPPIEMPQKSKLFFQFQFLLAFFAYNSTRAQQ